MSNQINSHHSLPAIQFHPFLSLSQNLRSHFPFSSEIALRLIRSFDSISIKEGVGMASLKQEIPVFERDDFLYDLGCDYDLGRLFLAKKLFIQSYVHSKHSEVSKFHKHLCHASCDSWLSRYADLCQQGMLDVHDLCMKMQKNYDGDCDKKPVGNQGDVSAAGKPEGMAESAGPKDKSIPQSRKDGSSPPAKEVPPDNEFKKRVRPEVVAPKDIRLTFQDIGGMDDIKELLQKLVIFPFKWPNLFKHDLLEPCKGILLFGPSGAGKTMLAKAVATEAGASFINCSMSTIISNVPGEVEKNVKEFFTLAAKVAPTIIFVDDVDSMLAKRECGEPVFMRILKNEFMSNWDDFMTKPGEQILVLGATNRPFDLDEAAIRRFEHRVMVGLPTPEDREKILRTVLSEVKTEGIDFKELARMTKDYTGSDLKNLCNYAAYRPVWELERLKDLGRKRAQEKENSEEGWQAKEDKTEKEGETITVGALTMEDMKAAKKQVAPSFPAEGALMKELKRWNEVYGGGGSREGERFPYFV